ncbi:hypothetical protein Poli38472_014217 [Pythium oligandrum]|uniref:Uncharacterized protein n=1 Tax=Pythium oligandrum TaxID=41045 RepID=A0A8K1CK25_PYTOL|nr:hypothetical protein Poli38472_014217 [Pythium oligandrum]|eukprot:TMW64100.1 hypothetical protein Poli38472_014217 [Pythium oligandrum]
MGTSPRPKRPRSTYEARRMERASLQHELQTLTKRLEQLQAEHPALVISKAQRACAENALLRQSLFERDLVTARTVSLLSHEMAAHPRNPLATPICMPVDLEERRRVLAALRPAKLAWATRFLLERSRFTPRDRQFRETESFITPQGDSIVMQFDVMPFYNVLSTQQVVNALQLALAHQEYAFWEHMGLTTIGETDDNATSPASQVRYFSTTPGGVDVERNLVIFSSSKAPNAHVQQDHGVVAVDFVDQDLLHPYSPAQRVRMDVSAAVLVCEQPKTPANASGSADVCVIRWAFARLHRPQCKLSPEKTQELLDLHPRWGEALRRAMQEYILQNSLARENTDSPYH